MSGGAWFKSMIQSCCLSKIVFVVIIMIKYPFFLYCINIIIVTLLLSSLISCVTLIHPLDLITMLLLDVPTWILQPRFMDSSVFVELDLLCTTCGRAVSVDTYTNTLYVQMFRKTDYALTVGIATAGLS